MSIFNKYVCHLILGVALVSVMNSCTEKKTEDTNEQSERERREQSAQKKKLEKEKRELELLKKKELESAKVQAAEEAEQAKIREAELLKAKLEEEQRIAAEEERMRLDDIASRFAEQDLAIEQYLGTKYEELELEDGRLLKSVKVTNANSIGVSFMHQNGVARIEYEELPEEIRMACLYDEELAELAEERERIMERKRLQAMADRKAEKAAKRLKSSSSKGSSSSSSRVSNKGESRTSEQEKEVKPKGKLTVRMVGTGSLGKKIEIKAITNVNATISLDGVYSSGHYYTRTYRVEAKKPFTIVVSNVKRKYTVKLNGGGKLLDTESSGRKSGLRDRNSL